MSGGDEASPYRVCAPNCPYLKGHGLAPSTNATSIPKPLHDGAFLGIGVVAASGLYPRPGHA